MSSDKSQDSISQDTIASLSFDFLKQLIGLSLAGAGGGAALIGTVFSGSPMRPLVLISIGLLFFAAILSLQAQQILVERMRAGSNSFTDKSKFKISRNARTEKLITNLSLGMFGAGVAALVFALVKL